MTAKTALKKTVAHEAGHGLGDLIHQPAAITNVGYDPFGLKLLEDTDLHVQRTSPNNNNIIREAASGNLGNNWINIESYKKFDANWPPPGENDFDPGVWPCTKGIPCPHYPSRAIIMEMEGSVWSIARSFSHKNAVFTPTASISGTGELRMLNDESSLLYSTRFDVPEWITGQNAVALIQVTDVPDVAKMELHWDSALEDSYTVTSNTPLITVTSPIDNQVLTTTTGVSWVATDIDGDDLTFNLAYSADGVVTVPLAVGLTANSFSLNSAAVPSGTLGTLLIRVSDGFNTALAVVKGLQDFTNAPPSVSILSPSSGYTTTNESRVVLVGRVGDFDQQWLPQNSIIWASSIDGILGYGWKNETQLSAGSHLVTLSATDRDGAVATDTITINVITP